MAQKTRKWEECISLKGETAKVVSYADYFARRPLFSSLQIKNTGEETIEGLTLCVENANGMLLPCEKEVEVPYESVVEVDLGTILSPLYFSDLEGVTEEKVQIVSGTNFFDGFIDGQTGEWATSSSNPFSKSVRRL